MQRIDRGASFPKAMQGKWIEVDDPTSEMVILGGEVTCFGTTVDYDYKEIVEIGGNQAVNLKVWDYSAEHSFQRTNITGLVIDSEGRFHVFNVKFSSTFARPKDDVT